MPYQCSGDCFEHCALVWLNVVVSFSLLIYGWKICFLLITSGLVQMLHKAYLLIIPAKLLGDRYSECVSIKTAICTYRVYTEPHLWVRI